MEEIKKNRKQRRFEAKLARSKKKSSGPTFKKAVQNMVRAMRDSKRVQNKIVNGELDKYLG